MTLSLISTHRGSLPTPALSERLVSFFSFVCFFFSPSDLSHAIRELSVEYVKTQGLYENRPALYPYHWIILPASQSPEVVCVSMCVFVCERVFEYRLH